MKSPGLIAVTILTLAIAGSVYADPDRSAVQIRKEYRGSEAPDHLMFAMELGAMKDTAAWNRDIALRIVQKHMQLDSEDAAKAFLSRMVAAATELESEHEKLENEMLCDPDAPRDKEAMYQRLDLVDDLREIKSHNAYVKFISSLDESQQDAMTAWLEKAKEGFYYRTAKHKSLFENSGYDVVGHVDMGCASRRNER